MVDEMQGEKRDIAWAAEQLKQGSKVRRKAWVGNEWKGYLQASGVDSNFVRMHYKLGLPDKRDENYRIPAGDMYATDWEVYEEMPDGRVRG